MAFVPNYENDVFISYSHIDNSPPINAQIGWVDIFREILQQRLFLRCSPKVTIFSDHQLRRIGETFPEQLEDAISRTASFISILSNPYVESDWCQRELRHFMTGAGIERILKVEKSIVDQISDAEAQKLFDRIKDVLTCKFYEQIKNTASYRDLMPELKADDLAACYDKIDLIAQDLTKVLRTLRAAVAQPAAGLAPPTAAIDSAADQFCVYLAEAAEDVQRERNDIRTELLQFNCRILPDQPLPDDRDQLVKAVSAYLGQAKLSVHLLGKDYGTIPPTEKRSLPHIQYDLARQMAQAGQCAQMVWTPERISNVDDLQTRLFDEVQSATPEFLRTTIEDFKTAIIKKINLQNDGAEPQTNGDGPVKVSLVCHESDRNSVGPLFSYLRLKEFFEVSVQNQAQLLPATDGVLMYYGNAGDQWFANTWKLIQRQSSSARSKPILAKAIYAGDPSSPEKDLLESEDLLIIRNYGQFTPTSLAPFIERIREAKGDPR